MAFPESHAASFALIAYASSWLKCHHPDVFCAALLNAQPMGFYAPAQIVRDARDHGVEVRPVVRQRLALGLHAGADRRRGSLRGSAWPAHGRGLANVDAAAIIAVRADQPFTSVDDLWRRAGVPAASLVEFAEADGFGPSWARPARGAVGDQGVARRTAAAVCRRSTREGDRSETSGAGVDAAADDGRPRGRRGLWPYRAHPSRPPCDLPPPDLRARIITCADAMQRATDNGSTTAGLVLVRQKPGSAKGVIFITLEDETGIANLVVWPKVFEKHRRVVLAAA